MIEQPDFQKCSESLARLGKLNPEKSKVLAVNLLQVWENFFLPADTNRDGSVELPELLVYMKSVCIWIQLFELEIVQIIF